MKEVKNMIGIIISGIAFLIVLGNVITSIIS